MKFNFMRLNKADGWLEYASHVKKDPLGDAYEEIERRRPKVECTDLTAELEIKLAELGMIKKDDIKKNCY